MLSAKFSINKSVAYALYHSFQHYCTQKYNLYKSRSFCDFSKVSINYSFVLVDFPR